MIYNKIVMKPLSQANFYLASTSPRRLSLLKEIGLSPQVLKPECEEEIISGLTPDKLVESLALQKLNSLSQIPGNADFIVASDTLVFYDSTPIGKPISTSDAFDILTKLQNNKHTVYTGVALSYKHDNSLKQLTFAVESNVWLRALSAEQIMGYIQTKEPLDKAGAYAIQGIGSSLVTRVEGSYTNVVGLPVSHLIQHIESVQTQWRLF
jgi:septum formation protein